MLFISEYLVSCKYAIGKVIIITSLYFASGDTVDPLAMAAKQKEYFEGYQTHEPHRVPQLLNVLLSERTEAQRDATDQPDEH